MTKDEFCQKAKSFGYNDAQIKSALDGMLDLRDNYGIDIDYDGIVIHPLQTRAEESKYNWQDGDVFIYQPKK
ncbi:MAG: hypothetical protein IK048_04110 [Clostridia bacterium]|nr:hypothetical protein [Clostridia bacterium]